MKRHTACTKALELLARLIKNKKSKIKEKQFIQFMESVEFQPFMQPIFNIDSQRMVGCEVLLRVRQDGEFISPVSFIKQLEHSTYINPVTILLLKKVADFFIEHDRSFPAGFYFSFNIYPAQLTSPEFVSELLLFSEKFRGKARLVLEIVERGVLAMDDATIIILKELVSKGILFAVDDFGAGTASLKYLEFTGFSIIKLDRELTQMSNNSLIYSRVIDAVVMLSSHMRLTVTAEGVEDAVQAEMLRRAGVDSLQGYYLAKPMEISEFLSLYWK